MNLPRISSIVSIVMLTKLFKLDYAAQFECEKNYMRYGIPKIVLELYRYSLLDFTISCSCVMRAV